MSTKESKNVPTAVAVDVEKKGDGFEYPVIQVGVAWGSGLEDLQSKSFCFDYGSVDFQPRCWNEFWSKQQCVYQRILKESKEPHQQWRDFIEFWDALPDKVTLVADNPAYDMAALDFHVWNEAKRLPIRHTKDGKYRFIANPTERDKAIPREDKLVLKQRAKETAKAEHDHWAENDAKHLLAYYFLVQDWLARSSKQQ